MINTTKILVAVTTLNPYTMHPLMDVVEDFETLQAITDGQDYFLGDWDAPFQVSEVDTIEAIHEKAKLLNNDFDDFTDPIQFFDYAIKEFREYEDRAYFENTEEFFNEHFDNDPLAAVKACQFGNYNYHHDCVRFDGFGNLESFDRYQLEKEAAKELENIFDLIFTYSL